MSGALTSSDQHYLEGELIPSWREKPYRMVKDVWGIDPENYQVRTLEALAKDHHVSVRSGHGIGKTATEAWAIWWALVCYFPVKCPCTAPNGNTLYDILWAELTKWHRAMPPWLRSSYGITATHAQLKRYEKESFATARTARKEAPEALQGFHVAPETGGIVLFTVEEASGVPGEVFEVAEGAMSSENAYSLMCGNPTRRTGYFAESHKAKRGFFTAIHVSCLDSPRVDRNWIRRMREKWGTDSNVYRVRVLGEFPESDDDALIPFGWIDGAINRDVQPYGDRVWGLDVARSGNNRNVLIKRCANVILEPHKAWRERDTTRTVGRVVQEWDLTPEEERPMVIYVDSIGVGGPVADQLRDKGLPARDVNVAEMPSLKSQFNNRRSELCFDVRDWFETMAVSIPDDSEIIGECSIMPMLPPTANGKNIIPPKDKIKDLLEIEASPDVFESLQITFLHRHVSRDRVKRAPQRTYTRKDRTRERTAPTGDLY